MGKTIDTFFLSLCTQVVQGHDPEKGNEEDAECGGETAERVASPECSQVEKVNNNGCKPELKQDTGDRKKWL